MKISLKSALMSGALLLTACGGVEDATEPALETSEQAIVPQCKVGNHTVLTFYWDSARTAVIGQRICACDNSITTTGTVSNFWTVNAAVCE